MQVTIDRIDPRRDARGAVFEPLGPDALADQRNAHIVLTAPGHVRGNHYHLRGTEVLVVRGPARVRWREAAGAGPAAGAGHRADAGEVREVAVPEGDVVAFTFPVGVPHAVQNTGAGEGLIVGFRDVEHDPTGADTVRHVLIEPPA